MQKQMFETISPVDDSVYVTRERATAQDINTALEQAEKAKKDWRTLSLTERKQYLQRFIDIIGEFKAEIATELAHQMGRPVSQGPGEVNGLIERATKMLELAEEGLSPIELPSQTPNQRFIQRDPKGLVFIIAPWNYPFLTAINGIIPALMAGNGVLLKHSEQTPLCAERLADAFAKAGLPQGVFQFLHMDHQSAAEIIQSRRVNHVIFTGSVQAGKKIHQLCAQNLVSVGLELGGKDPAYVTAECNLPFTVENLVDGSFFNSGQSCCGIERIYVHQSRFKEFVDAFIAQTETYQLGNPLDAKTNLGPMSKTQSAEIVRQAIQEAVKSGATAALAPQQFAQNKEGTAYLAPQVLLNVTHDMNIMREETFGPVVGIMSVPDDETAVNLMNDSQYGLSASIWTDNLEHGLALGQKVETGTCFVNRCDYLDPALAWNGVKDTGLGCSLSVLAYNQVTQPKSFNLRSSV